MVGVAANLGGPSAVVGATSAASLRILYSSDWSGPTQIYAVDPSGRAAAGQLTFGASAACREVAGHACGYIDAVPAPDGRHVLYSDFSYACHTGLYVADADGSGRLRLGSVAGYCDGQSLQAAWAPDSIRLAYVGQGGIHLTDADGGSDRVVGVGRDPAWSPDGRLLAYISVDHRLVVVRGGRRRVLGSASGFAWAPSGERIAYASAAGLALVRWDGSGRRVLVPGAVDGLSWSSDGDFLAFDGAKGIETVAVSRPASRVVVSDASGNAPGWSPNGRLLAFVDSRGVEFHDVASGLTRLLAPDRPAELVWSPDGARLAYLAPRADFAGYPTREHPRVDLRVVDLAGTVRTLVAATGDRGGFLSGVAWTRRPPSGYRRPAPRTLAAVTSSNLDAPWPIERLAADGGRVAYVACGHVFVWTPADGRVVQADPLASMSPWCPSAAADSTIPPFATPFRVFALTLAGDRALFGAQEGNTSKYCWLGSTDLTLVSGGPGCLYGNAAASGSLLVFSTWSLRLGQPPYPVTSEAIHAVPAAGCPCPVLRQDPGPLVPLDVDAARVVAGGSNATVVLDATGEQLLSVPVPAFSAQLSGSDLVVLVPGELRDYDASSGSLLRAWPLADVPSGGDCGIDSGDARECPATRLRLEDARRGLVTCVLDGQVHLLRLADGADDVVAPGTRARFMDKGLVYADGARLTLVPYDQLPLR